MAENNDSMKISNLVKTGATTRKKESSRKALSKQVVLTKMSGDQILLQNLEAPQIKFYLTYSEIEALLQWYKRTV